MNSNIQCDLPHPGTAWAVVRIEVKSMRIHQPGRPMVRRLAICASHARELRRLGISTVAHR
jgi:hypothetical protein